MITIPLDVNSSQVSTEWHSTPEQEVLYFHIEIDVSRFHWLSSHTATQEVKVITRLDDDGSIEPVG